MPSASLAVVPVPILADRQGLPRLRAVPALAAATPWQDVVAAYLNAGVDSPSTRRAYGRHLRAAFALLEVETVAELTGAHLAAYRAHVLERPLAPNTQAQTLIALRAFLGWSRTLGAHHLGADVVRIALKTPRATVQRPYNVLADADLGALFAAVPHRRDRALLAVALGGGLRAAELAGLDVTDLVDDAEGLNLYVRQGKGRKDRTVPVHADVRSAVFAFLTASGRRLGDAGPLFSAHDRAAHARPGSRLTTRSIGKLVARAVAAAGLAAKGISPHSCRHTMAIRYLRGGGSLVALAKILGHASVSTTQRYVDHLELGELRATLPGLPGAAS